MVQFSGPGPKHGLIAAVVMFPARVPSSPLPGLSVPVKLPPGHLIKLPVLGSLIVALTSPNVTAPPGLMVQVAAARAGAAARPRARPAARPASRIRAGREHAINRIGRAYAGKPGPSRRRLAPQGSSRCPGGRQRRKVRLESGQQRARRPDLPGEPQLKGQPLANIN